jgi:hypothetical protein
MHRIPDPKNCDSRKVRYLFRFSLWIWSEVQRILVPEGNVTKIGYGTFLYRKAGT